MTGNNRRGRAGKGGVPAASVVAFLDHYTYTHARHKYINGEVIPEPLRRQIRRWHHQHTAGVNPAYLLVVLEQLRFNIAWFHAWCKERGYPVTF
jgi:hypothetical protein